MTSGLSSKTRFMAATLLAGMVAAALPPGSPAQAISESEVEATCADSREAHHDYLAATEQFQKATQALDEANLALAEAESKEQRIRSQYQSNENRRQELQPDVEAQAVDLYMRSAGSGTVGLIALDDPEDALVAYELISTSTRGSLDALTDLSAIASELDRLDSDLAEVVATRTELRDEQRARTDEQQEALATALVSYEDLTDECKELQARYEAEQARLRAEAEARRRRQAARRERAARQKINGAICPFDPGRTQFTNSFGAPRSGGRSHRGTDMFAPMEEPIYAVESGVVSVDERGLGGKQIFLRASSGRAYYYAHLSGFNVSDGSSVEQGQLIAFNGNSGNARGTSPHLHIQIYPNGYRGGVVNPYHTMVEVCF